MKSLARLSKRDIFVCGYVCMLVYMLLILYAVHFDLMLISYLNLFFGDFLGSNLYYVYLICYLFHLIFCQTLLL